MCPHSYFQPLFPPAPNLYMLAPACVLSCSLSFVPIPTYCPFAPIHHLCPLLPAGYAHLLVIQSMGHMHSCECPFICANVPMPAVIHTCCLCPFLPTAHAHSQLSVLMLSSLVCVCSHLLLLAVIHCTTYHT